MNIRDEQGLNRSARIGISMGRLCWKRTGVEMEKKAPARGEMTTTTSSTIERLLSKTRGTNRGTCVYLSNTHVDTYILERARFDYCRVIAVWISLR